MIISGEVMVEKYKYDKINDYFNPLFGKLYSLEDWPIEFYQDYIELMSGIYLALEDSIVEATDGYIRIQSYNRDKLTIMEIIDITKQVLQSIDDQCDSNYVEIFEESINNGALDFVFRNEEQDEEDFDATCSANHVRYVYYPEINEGNFIYNTIDMTSDRSYQTVVDLIHEFFHYTNALPGPSKSRGVLTEGISIYFEMYATDYLLQNHICDPTDLTPLSRAAWMLKDIPKLDNYGVFLAYFATKGDLSDDSYEDVNEMYELSEEEYADRINLIYNVICNLEKKYKDVNESNTFVEDGIEYTDEEISQDTKEAVVRDMKDSLGGLGYFFGIMIASHMRLSGSVQRMSFINKSIPKKDDIYYYFEQLEIDLDKMLHEISTLENMDQLSLIINEIIYTFKHFNEYEKEADQLFEEKKQKQLKKEV